MIDKVFPAQAEALASDAVSTATSTMKSAASSMAGLFNVDVNKLLTEFKVPGVDVDAMMASQRKNIEALTKANQLAFEGVQAMARRQTEILRTGFEQATMAMRDVMSPQSQGDRVAKQTELAKVSVEHAISNARELAEILTKAQTEAFEVLNRRFSESIDEVKSLVKK